MIMIHGAMNYTTRGKKKKVNYWTKPKNTYKREFTDFVPEKTYRREDPTTEIKSLTTNKGTTAKKESPKYTGTLVKGISTMHKSNAVPIIDEQEARDHASMRR